MHPELLTAGHTLILRSSMANSHHIPGLIRGHHGTIIMVDHGKFESPTDHIEVIPEVGRVKGEKHAIGGPDYEAKFGMEPTKIAVDPKDVMETHVANFLDCMHTRQKPHLDVETGARGQAVGRVMYWDDMKCQILIVGRALGRLLFIRPPDSASMGIRRSRKWNPKTRWRLPALA